MDVSDHHPSSSCACSSSAVSGSGSASSVSLEELEEDPGGGGRLAGVCRAGAAALLLSYFATPSSSRRGWSSLGSGPQTGRGGGGPAGLNPGCLSGRGPSLTSSRGVLSKPSAEESISSCSEALPSDINQLHRRNRQQQPRRPRTQERPRRTKTRGSSHCCEPWGLKLLHHHHHPRSPCRRHRLHAVRVLHRSRIGRSFALHLLLGPAHAAARARHLLQRLLRTGAGPKSHGAVPAVVFVSFPVTVRKQQGARRILFTLLSCRPGRSEILRFISEPIPAAWPNMVNQVRGSSTCLANEVLEPARYFPGHVLAPKEQQGRTCKSGV